MGFAALKVAGSDALRLLKEHRLAFPATGKYPFMIGDREQLEHYQAAAVQHQQNLKAIVEASIDAKAAEWIARRRKTLEECEYPLDEILGEWPGEVHDKGSTSIQKDRLKDKLKPEIYIGLAEIETPWHLPSAIGFGGWNDCPEPEVQCAFHRRWQKKFGAEITGIAGDVVECTVSNPPTDKDTAIALAWEQFWYCGDIVEQGCETVSYLAATLLNSPYWFFWWD